MWWKQNKLEEEKMVHEKLSLSNQLSERRTELATDRTLMAASRTLMAWVRTGISQISFGFSLYKILDQFLRKGNWQIRIVS